MGILGGWQLEEVAKGVEVSKRVLSKTLVEEIVTGVGIPGWVLRGRWPEEIVISVRVIERGWQQPEEVVIGTRILGGEIPEVEVLEWGWQQPEVAIIQIGQSKIEILMLPIFLLLLSLILTFLTSWADFFDTSFFYIFSFYCFFLFLRNFLFQATSCLLNPRRYRFFYYHSS